MSPEWRGLDQMSDTKDELKVGVKTPEGKQKVRYNSFKHGLRSNALVTAPSVLGETQEEYDQLFEDLKVSICPQSPFEEFCVHSIAKAMFKLRRAEALEASALYERTPSFEWDMVKRDSRPTLGISDSSQLELVMRYRIALNNEITKALSSIHNYRQFFQLDLFGNTENPNEG
jgi:hypothetical protein